MPERLFDPAIHQSTEPLVGYRFDNEALVEKLAELKKAPTKDMIAFLDAHPEYKSFNCTALAEYAGISEPTLKKLKTGQIADPRGSTFWILFNKFGIRPREVLKCIPPGICNVDCANQAKIKLGEVMQQSETNQAEIARLRLKLLAEGKKASAAEAHAKAMEAQVTQLEKRIRMRNQWLFVIGIFIVLLFIADLLMANYGWLRFGPIK